MYVCPFYAFRWTDTKPIRVCGGPSHPPSPPQPPPHNKTNHRSFSLPSLVDAEPGYHAALALYLTLRVYGIPAPPGKTWLRVLDVADSDESFARAWFGSWGSGQGVVVVFGWSGGCVLRWCAVLCGRRLVIRLCIFFGYVCMVVIML